MREALLVCPKATNNGKPLTGLLDDVAGKLIRAFGGCTIREATGCWLDEASGKVFRDNVWECVAACDVNPNNDTILRSIAEFIGWRGEQLAVYIRYSSGNVEILDTSSVGRKAA
jgi:hypothetical protein